MVGIVSLGGCTYHLQLDVISSSWSVRSNHVYNWFAVKEHIYPLW